MIEGEGWTLGSSKSLLSGCSIAVGAVGVLMATDLKSALKMLLMMPSGKKGIVEGGREDRIKRKVSGMMANCSILVIRFSCSFMRDTQGGLVDYVI